MTHQPVLVKEVLEYLDPKPDGNFIDGTVGQGGHAKEILQRTGPKGILLGIDWDEKQIENSKVNLKEFGERAILVNGSYADIGDIAGRLHGAAISGILVDVGFSSWQTDDSGKGFSFQKDEPLDMRYGDGELTAAEIINQWPEEKICEIIEQFGEEKFARKIAKHIVEARKHEKIESTFELRDIIERAVSRREKIHPATRTFQALRIAVNGELENLERFLPDALKVLAPGGRLVVISFHSLEDRIVKNFFKSAASAEGSGVPKQKITILTNKPVGASDEEVAQNPRSRSAKLRAIVKVSE